MELTRAEFDKTILNKQKHAIGPAKGVPYLEQLLQLENKCLLPWILKKMPSSQKGLDIGCGNGFASNFLALNGHSMTAVDLSEQHLANAKKGDGTQSVQYLKTDAYHLPFLDGSFDFVLCLGLLEFVSAPDLIIQQAARVLKPNGRLIFHTHPRSLATWLLLVKGANLYSKNLPTLPNAFDFHLNYRELQTCLKMAHLRIENETGVRPRFNSAFLYLLRTGKISSSLHFTISSHLWLSYMGIARKIDSAT